MGFNFNLQLICRQILNFKIPMPKKKFNLHSMQTILQKI